MIRNPDSVASVLAKVLPVNSKKVPSSYNALYLSLIATRLNKYMDPKKLAAEKAVDYVQDGMILGLGTGSTAYWAIQLIGEKVRAGMRVTAIPTSASTEKLAKELNIPLARFHDVASIDLTIDGADEIDREKNLIKGGGGALMREKIVAYNSNQFIVIADESKLVHTLGKFPLPVEVVPFGAELTLRQIMKLCSDVQIRQRNGQAYFTDNGNVIIDCQFKAIADPESLDMQLKKIPGVLETGIFLKSKVSMVVVGNSSGVTVIGNQ